MRTKKILKISKGRELVTRSYLDMQLKQEFGSQLAPINVRLGRLEGRFADLKVTVDEMKGTMREMDGKIDRGFGKQDAFLKHLDDQKSENAAQIIINSRVDARLGKLEHEVFAR